MHTIKILTLVFILTAFGADRAAASILPPEFVSSSVSIRENSELTVHDDDVAATITFDLEATGEDAYISLNPNISILFQVRNSNSEIVQAFTVAISLERVSGGSQTGNFIRLSDGQSARFRFNLNFQVAQAGAVRLELLGVNYSNLPGGSSMFVAADDINTNYIAQWGNGSVPEPSAIIIALVGLAALTRCRRRR